MKGALFAQNNPALLKLFEPRVGNLVDRLAKLPDDSVPDELFLSVLSRPSSDDDHRDVLELLSGGEAFPADTPRGERVRRPKRGRRTR